MIRAVSAFIKKDFWLETSYRLNFFLNIGGMFFLILIFYFISKLIGASTNTMLAGYGGDYFTFVLIGLVFANYISWALNSLTENIRQEQLMGTLETLLVSPITNSSFIMGEYTWTFFYTAFETVIYIIFGIYVLGARFIAPNIPAAIIIAMLTIFVLITLGILSASFILVFKKGDPLTLILAYTFQITSGVYFPTSVLPGWLKNIADFIPVTYGLEGIRLALTKSYSIQQLLPQIGMLAAYTVVLLPISLCAFNYAITRAKISGSLSHY